MRLADRVQEPRERALEADAERPVVGRLVAVHRGAEGAAEGVAPAPALQARGAVARAHRLAVVEAQALAQPDRPGPAVAAGVVAFRHLRLRAHGAVHAVERVEDVVAVLHGDQRGREDRVERDEVGRGHEAQCARPRVLADRGQRQGGCCRYLQEVAALAGHRAASSEMHRSTLARWAGEPRCDPARSGGPPATILRMEGARTRRPQADPRSHPAGAHRHPLRRPPGIVSDLRVKEFPGGSPRPWIRSTRITMAGRPRRRARWRRDRPSRHPGHHPSPKGGETPACLSHESTCPSEAGWPARLERAFHSLPDEPVRYPGVSDSAMSLTPDLL